MSVVWFLECDVLRRVGDQDIQMIAAHKKIRTAPKGEYSVDEDYIALKTRFKGYHTHLSALGKAVQQAVEHEKQLLVSHVSVARELMKCTSGGDVYVNSCSMKFATAMQRIGMNVEATSANLTDRVTRPIQNMLGTLDMVKKRRRTLKKRRIELY